jgi:DHA1 family tetracycline resistance protein-like MFS transporter
MIQTQWSGRSAVLLMALTILIDFIGFGLTLPLLPFWAEHAGANAFGVGMLITMYALAQFIFTPVLGALSDRYGRRPIIITSLLIEAISLALTALASNLPMLFLARFIGGLGASNIGSAQAVVADVTTPDHRARGMGLIGAAIGIGFVLGPAMSGVLAPTGLTVPFWVAMGVALVNAMLVMLFLPETHARQPIVSAKAASYKDAAILISGWQMAYRYPVILRLTVINLLFMVAFTGMETVFALFAQHYFGWTASQIGYIFTYVGVIIVIVQGGLVGLLVKRIGEQSLLRIGLVLLAGGLILLAFSIQVALVLLSLGILSVGDGVVNPAISTLVSFASPAESQGEILGLAQGVSGLGRIIGPLAAGSIYVLLRPGTPFIAGSMLVVVAALLALPTLSVFKHQSVTSSEEQAEEQSAAHVGRHRSN